MNNWDFTDSRLKVTRAKRHLEELNLCLSNWVQSNPHRVSINKESVMSDNVLKVSVTESVPNDLPLIIGDVAQNLRSALDFIAIEIVKKAGLGLDHVQFPVHETEGNLIDAVKKSKLAQASPMAADTILNRIKPYKAANIFIWTLNRISNIDKHRILVRLMPRSEFKVPLKYNDRVSEFILIVNSNKSIDVPIKGSNGFNVEIDNNPAQSYSIFFDSTQIPGLPMLHISDFLTNCANVIERHYIPMFEGI